MAKSDRIFRIVWSLKRQIFVATDETGADLAISTDKSAVIDKAVREADLASREGRRVFVKVGEVSNGICGGSCTIDEK